LKPVHLIASLATAVAVTCHSSPRVTQTTTLDYVGSSTVALFVQEADLVLPDFEFCIDTQPESDGASERYWPAQRT
jgi:hypothetical protein